MKNSPQELGLLPYGQEEASTINKLEQKKNPVTIAFQTLFEAVKLKGFWLLAGASLSVDFRLVD